MDCANFHENAPVMAELSGYDPAKDASVAKGSNAGKNDLMMKEVGKYILKAIEELQGQNGSLVKEIKNVLASKHRLNVKEQAEDISTFLKVAVESGTLTITDGKYKIAERARRRRRSGSRKRSGGRRRTRSRRSGGRKRSGSRRRRSSGRRKTSGRRRSTRRRRSRKHKHTPGDECDM